MYLTDTLCLISRILIVIKDCYHQYSRFATKASEAIATAELDHYRNQISYDCIRKIH